MCPTSARSGRLHGRTLSAERCVFRLTLVTEEEDRAPGMPGRRMPGGRHFVFTRRRSQPSQFAQAVASPSSLLHVSKLIGRHHSVSLRLAARGSRALHLLSHMSELDQSQEKITSDAATAEYGTGAAELFEGAAEDNIGRLVVSTIQEPRTVMSVISATAFPGRAADVVVFGTECTRPWLGDGGAGGVRCVGLRSFRWNWFAMGADSMAGLQAATRAPEGCTVVLWRRRAIVRARERPVGDLRS